MYVMYSISLLLFIINFIIVISIFSRYLRDLAHSSVFMDFHFLSFHAASIICSNGLVSSISTNFSKFYEDMRVFEMIFQLLLSYRCFSYYYQTFAAPSSILIMILIRIK